MNFNPSLYHYLNVSASRWTFCTRRTRRSRRCTRRRCEMCTASSFLCGSAHNASGVSGCGSPSPEATIHSAHSGKRCASTCLANFVRPRGREAASFRRHENDHIAHRDSASQRTAHRGSQQASRVSASMPLPRRRARRSDSSGASPAHAAAHTCPRSEDTSATLRPSSFLRSSRFALQFLKKYKNNVLRGC